MKTMNCYENILVYLAMSHMRLSGKRNLHRTPMLRLEAARTELEAVRTEVERLQAENVKLREAQPEQAKAVDRAAEVKRLKELYAQALRDIQAKDEQVEVVQHELDDMRQQLKLQETAAQELQSKCQELEETCDTVHVQVSRARQEDELECL